MATPTATKKLGLRPIQYLPRKIALQLLYRYDSMRVILKPTRRTMQYITPHQNSQPSSTAYFPIRVVDHFN